MLNVTGTYSISQKILWVSSFFQSNIIWNDTFWRAKSLLPTFINDLAKLQV